MSKNIIGLKQLESKLDKLSDKRTYEKALGQSALIVESDAKRRAPVDTGILRNSIHTKVHTSELKATIGTPIEYAPYVEYGTGIKGQGSSSGSTRGSGMAPQPYLGPALRANRTKVQEHFQRVVEKELKK